MYSEIMARKSNYEGILENYRKKYQTEFDNLIDIAIKLYMFCAKNFLKIKDGKKVICPSRYNKQI